MSMEQTACEDLKAFERRLQEMINCLQPQTNRYRLLLFLSTLCTTIGVFQWLTDPLTPRISLISSLLGHPFFTLNVILLILLFALTGIHKKVVEPQIIMSRVRQVLANFNMSCDDSGRLILKPRPSPR